MVVVYVLVGIICFVFGALVGFGVGVMGTHDKAWGVRIEFG